MKKRTLYLIRILLGILIVANMVVIYLFSAQNGQKSDQTSGRVTQAVAETFVQDFEKKPEPEQQQIVKDLHPPVRKLAHMLEFGSLGALILLLALTWRGSILLRWGGTLFATLLYACFDECHQILRDGRGPQISDVFIDLSGAVITCTVIALLAFLIKRRNGPYTEFQTTRYTIADFGKPLRVAIASDLHGTPHKQILEALKAEKPDAILIPGDLTDDEGLRDTTNPAYEFLRACAKIAPTYYSLGNHELACYHKGNPWRHPIPRPLDGEIRSRIAKTGAVLLDNDCVSSNGITYCGLTSGINGKESCPDKQTLNRFSALREPKILLCHHPEYFMPYIRKTDIPLTVCGHAHGGQWRFFGRGTYAPGQGIFPKYTAGVLEKRCVISRGLGNHTWIPRIFNLPELIVLELK